ncbi:hypothetical protein LRR81_09045 [Metabacillus sp. GX 13764]|uniref:hypothetical protein n=1 Tax=Metabacillus kandeliae TaxID=2900151 RepID=UPI001E3B8D72|nr:hypothetical protein [Metabacillus kandeliae]MCD7034381.1 hypothetical protein [Metabacillus kandeliae]
MREGPYQKLSGLEKLAGTWKVSGPDIEGTVSFQWMEGKYFMIQHFDLLHSGRQVKGIEVIGLTKEFGAEEPGEHLVSRAYDNSGNTFDYTYEIDDDTLTIWGGGIGSPAYYKGEWNSDGTVNSGKWVYPGGGYESAMTRTDR